MEYVMPPDLDLPVLLFPTPKAWSAWLTTHHAKSDGIWMRIAKLKSALTSITYAEAVDGALCHGWIDGQKKPYDADSWIQRFTPRRARSVWSRINRGKAQALIKSGRMRPAGQRAIDLAKKEGRWFSAYDSARTASPPPDLLAALDKKPRAKSFFETLTGNNRYAILYRLQTAMRPETRKKRLTEIVRMLTRGETYHAVTRTRGLRL